MIIRNFTHGLALGSLIFSINNLKTAETVAGADLPATICCGDSCSISSVANPVALQRAERAAALADSVSLSQIALELLDGKSVEDFSDEQRDIAQEWSEIISKLLALNSFDGCEEEDKNAMRSCFTQLVAIHSTVHKMFLDLGDFKPKTEIEEQLFADFNKPNHFSPSKEAVSLLEVVAAQDPEALAEMFGDLDRMILIAIAREMGPKSSQILMGASFLQLEFFPQEFASNAPDYLIS
ncbi:MAG TPA: hypothetical protein VJJ81_02410 [Candidatus Babeliales bacterium]|nr:hypothetical protein [Candidatus Babeliales bacterium]